MRERRASTRHRSLLLSPHGTHFCRLGVIADAYSLDPCGGLSKQYRVGRSELQNNTIRDVISHSFRAGADAVRSMFNRGHPISLRREWFWALRDVAFEVPAGQVVGIVGANGAGKSTLLKVLSKITEPTTGRVEIRGRVGSLIEVGTGFHSELTGRENTYLNGAILGMRRSEIDRKFDEIVAFAGVERFIDTPIKHYSSGMQLRLGFGVAAHLETEILIVDEVLAVGDAEFQKKCLSTMSRVANDGRTVLFVSHNATAVKTLCHRAIWLKEGRIAGDGPSGEVLSSYLMSSAGTVPERVWHGEPEPGSPCPVALYRVAARPEAGTPNDRITSAAPFLIEVDYWSRDRMPRSRQASRCSTSRRCYYSRPQNRGRMGSSYRRTSGYVEQNAACLRISSPGRLSGRGDDPPQSSACHRGTGSALLHYFSTQITKRTTAIDNGQASSDHCSTGNPARLLSANTRKARGKAAVATSEQPIQRSISSVF